MRAPRSLPAALRGTQHEMVHKTNRLQQEALHQHGEAR